MSDDINMNRKTPHCLNTACRKPLALEKVRALSGFCWACEQAKPQVSAQQAKVLMCTRCGNRPAMHEVYRWWTDPPKEELCCPCNAQDEDSDPADFHPGCVSEWRKRHPEAEA